MADYYLVITSWPDFAGATRQAQEWLEKKLAANVNIMAEMESIYHWKGEIRTGNEHQMLIKTSADRVDALEREIRRVHPYAVAEILRIAIDSGNPDYLDWISHSTR
jgi:periplasmic divalent cation tolerance protein